MLQKTVNPYPYLGTKYSDGLDYIITHLPGSPTVDDLVSTVLAYINTLSWFGSTPPSLPVEINSVAYSAINSYTNGQVWSMYSGAQRMFLNDLIGLDFIDNNTIDTVKDNILDIQDNISRRGMSIDAQTPLYFATMMGQTGYDYWLTQINMSHPLSSPWSTYLNTALVSATTNLPFYISAGMEGALIGARSTPRSMIAPTTAVVSNEIICSLIGALTIGAGKIIFKWIPRANNMLRIETLPNPDKFPKEPDLLRITKITDCIYYVEFKMEYNIGPYHIVTIFSECIYDICNSMSYCIRKYDWDGDGNADNAIDLPNRKLENTFAIEKNLKISDMPNGQLLYMPAGIYNYDKNNRVNISDKIRVGHRV